MSGNSNYVCMEYTENSNSKRCLTSPQSMDGFDPGVIPMQGVDAEGINEKLICRDTFDQMPA